eukprot:TRINITY_DN72096_c0_g1_i1.p2 TRINITY_DN72096_c0_g1~~TRINITY_DN72096_c0_g1_i1.p2  ORF type:complete len:191 (+),score=56.40 TRINITY_DN72096_c0_g1_i1:70-573(+)
MAARSALPLALALALLAAQGHAATYQACIHFTLKPRTDNLAWNVGSGVTFTFQGTTTVNGLLYARYLSDASASTWSARVVATPHIMHFCNGWVIARGSLSCQTAYHDFEVFADSLTMPVAPATGETEIHYITTAAEGADWRVCDHGNPARCSENKNNIEFTCTKMTS